MKHLKTYSDWLWLALAGTVTMLGLVSMMSADAPHIQVTAGTSSVDIKADRAWAITPSDCVMITWEIEGISALYVDGEGQIGADNMVFCPQVNLTSPEIEVIDNDGISRRYQLKIHYLLDELLYALSFAGILFAGITLVYYLMVPDITQKPPIAFAIFLAITLSFLVGVMRHNAPPAPVIDTQDGETMVYFSADNHRALFPEECITLRWHVVNANSVLVNGVEQLLEGESEHCQQDGDIARLQVDDSTVTHNIPLSFLFSHLLDTSWYAVLSVIALILCGVIFLPLLARIALRSWQWDNRQDFVVGGTLLLLAIILFLPFGWAHVGHWEEWVIKAYIEGMPNEWLDNELRTRLFVIVPHTLAHILTPESFVGYNLMHMMMFFGKSLFLYGILRKLNLSVLIAFLISALFMIYPVNSAIMSLRSFPMQFSALSLLLAGYLILHLREHPSRLAIAGTGLALLFSVGANESGYLIILIAPLFWLVQERRLSWKAVNLAANWYMMPAVRGVFTFGLLATGRGFYLSGNLDNMAGSPLERLSPILRALRNSYHSTFPQGWAEAIGTASSADYLLWSAIGTGLVLICAWWLYRRSTLLLSLRQTVMLIIAGLLFLIPAVGVMISLDFYRNDTWRVFFYAPISGAVVAVGLLLVIANCISSDKSRRVLLLILAGLLIFPSLNRALNQHSDFVNQAIAKEDFFRALVEQAPSLDPSAQVIVVSELPLEDLRTVGLHELVRRDMFSSALYLLYDETPPQYVSVCVMNDSCTADEEYVTVMFPFREIPYDELVIFYLDADLSLSLIESLIGFAEFPQDIGSYQSGQYVKYDNLPMGLNLP